MKSAATGLIDSFIKVWAGRVDQVALCVVGAWVAGMGVSFVLGSPMNGPVAALVLVGNLMVVAVALCLKLRRNGK